MKQLVQTTYLPNAIVLYKQKDTEQFIEKLAPAHKDKTALEQHSTFYLCENFACQQPVISFEEVKRKLKQID